MAKEKSAVLNDQNEVRRAAKKRQRAVAQAKALHKTAVQQWVPMADVVAKKQYGEQKRKEAEENKKAFLANVFKVRDTKVDTYFNIAKTKGYVEIPFPEYDKAADNARFHAEREYEYVCGKVKSLCKGHAEETGVYFVFAQETPELLKIIKNKSK